jgi:hypothetical protein
MVQQARRTPNRAGHARQTSRASFPEPGFLLPELQLSVVLCACLPFRFLLFDFSFSDFFNASA